MTQDCYVPIATQVPLDCFPSLPLGVHCPDADPPQTAHYYRAGRRPGAEQEGAAAAPQDADEGRGRAGPRPGRGPAPIPLPPPRAPRGPLVTDGLINDPAGKPGPPETSSLAGQYWTPLQDFIFFKIFRSFCSTFTRCMLLNIGPSPVAWPTCLAPLPVVAPPSGVPSAAAPRPHPWGIGLRSPSSTLRPSRTEQSGGRRTGRWERRGRDRGAGMPHPRVMTSSFITSLILSIPLARGSPILK